MSSSNNTPPAGQAPAGVGSNPPAYRYQPSDNDADTNFPSMPVPWWFNPPTAKLYRNLSMKDSDIIVSSGAKMGTTWVTRILVSLLYEYDNEGNVIPTEVDNRKSIPGRTGQVYPDALYATRKEKEIDALGIYTRVPGGPEFINRAMGDYVFDDMLNQPEPRLFVSHLFGESHLPKELFDDDESNRKGKGRLIVVVRNLKDAMVSLHHFRGTAADGWLGNEHGPGSFHRYINTTDCPNAMGNAFHWVRDNAKAADAIGKERALVVYYENLILDFGSELQRINDFLGDLGTLSEAKCNAIEEACTLTSMKALLGKGVATLRKGGICGWKDVNELTDDEHWSEFDKVFDEVLGDVEIAKPMKLYQTRNASITAKENENKVAKPFTSSHYPIPMKQSVDGVPMPPFFRHDSWQVYRNMDLRDDDIILSSGVKMGTTWVTKVLNCLLHDIDDDGNPTDMHMDDSYPNKLGQSYPESMPPTREIERQEVAPDKVKMREWVKSHFGNFTCGDLMNQPAPRLFSSHLFGKKLLPKQLFDGWEEANDKGAVVASTHPNGSHDQSNNKGKGRLIVVVRNLKDTLVSLHHFRGEPKDGWFGNQHGPGSFNRWIDLETCSNAYGNAFQWVKISADAVEDVGPKRALVIYYEDLILTFDAELRRINEFLGLKALSEAKAIAVRKECSIENMRSNSVDRFQATLRKGKIGDWKNYLDDEHWEQVDRIFNEVLGDVELAKQLQLYQRKDTLTTGVFNFVRLKEGCDAANAFEGYEQDAHTLEVHNARLLSQDDDILLSSSTGFKVVSHVSSIKEWSNEELLSSTYHDEVFSVLRKLTGAEHIFLGGPHVSRREDSADARAQPLYHLHNDYTGNMKEAYMRGLSGEEPNQSWTMEEMLAMSFVDGSDVPAQMKAAGLTAEELAKRRMIVLNTWRNTSDEPVGRCPLAVADQRTIKSGDGCGGVVGRCGLVRREGQKFYYFPGLTREELLVFIGYDSDAKEHAPCVHSGFEDMNAPADGPPRQSIELRCVLVMPPASQPQN